MTMLEALKNPDRTVRLEYEDRWFVYDNIHDLWVVYERRPNDRNSKMIIQTPSEENAVRELLKG